VSRFRRHQRRADAIRNPTSASSSVALIRASDPPAAVKQAASPAAWGIDDLRTQRPGVLACRQRIQIGADPAVAPAAERERAPARPRYGERQFNRREARERGERGRPYAIAAPVEAAAGGPAASMHRRGSCGAP
jgi:hypothetical protein